MEPISQELAKDGNTICLGTDLREQEGLKGARVKAAQGNFFCSQTKKTVPSEVSILHS